MSLHFTVKQIDEEQVFKQAPVSGLWAALVAKGAAESTDLITVTIPDYDDNAVFGPARWPAIGESLPARGDICLVGIDNQSNVWVISWVPS